MIEPLKSKIITTRDALEAVITSALKKHPLKSGDILVIASKVVAITQGRVHVVRNDQEFNTLVKQEADRIVGGEQVTLTLKNGIFIPWAGVDRSNAAQGEAIAWPNEPFKVAQQLQLNLKKKFKLKQLGVLITDSYCIPRRRGVSGVALGYAGFKGVNDLRGKKDLFGNKLKVTQQAVADNLASASHLVMGESNEQTPFAIIHHAPVVFTSAKINPKEPVMAAKECLYVPLYGKIAP